MVKEIYELWTDVWKEKMKKYRLMEITGEDEGIDFLINLKFTGLYMNESMDLLTVLIENKSENYKLMRMNLGLHEFWTLVKQPTAKVNGLTSEQKDRIYKEAERFPFLEMKKTFELPEKEKKRLVAFVKEMNVKINEVNTLSGEKFHYRSGEYYVLNEKEKNKWLASIFSLGWDVDFHSPRRIITEQARIHQMNEENLCKLFIEWVSNGHEIPEEQFFGAQRVTEYIKNEIKKFEDKYLKAKTERYYIFKTNEG